MQAYNVFSRLLNSIQSQHTDEQLNQYLLKVANKTLYLISSLCEMQLSEKLVSQITQKHLDLSLFPAAERIEWFFYAGKMYLHYHNFQQVFVLI